MDSRNRDKGPGYEQRMGPDIEGKDLGSREQVEEARRLALGLPEGEEQGLAGTNYMQEKHLVWAAMAKRSTAVDI